MTIFKKKYAVDGTLKSKIAKSYRWRSNPIPEDEERKETDSLPVDRVAGSAEAEVETQSVEL